MKTCCDHECANANNCLVGGITCDWCGNYFCSSDLAWHGSRRVCEDCKAEMEAEEQEGDEK